MRVAFHAELLHSNKQLRDFDDKKEEGENGDKQ